MQTATADTLVGRRLEGRYRILDRIARGGMSTVYAAVDERLDRMVAVKVMSSVLSNDPAFTDRFAREARAAARLTHLNAVSVYDQGHDSGHGAGADGGHHVFLVMELVEGRTLRELLRERGRLSVPEAVSIMEPVLSALSAAHRAGLVHRDVKPENILLSDEGVVKVADFGLARAVETDPSNTRTGLMMGTVAYCAPEQISKGNADPRSDVYAAGIVLFEMLTGAPPYNGDSAMNVAWQHVHSRVPAPSSRVREVPTEIDEVVVAATDSDPSGRPSDAGAFLAEIADVRTALALPVMPVPARVRPRRDQRRDAHAEDPQHATTDMLGDRPRRHDTMIAPDHEPRRAPAGRAAPRDGEPPPPVVIPPRAQRRHRKRRAAIAWVIVILLGLGSFFGARAIIEWRFAHIPDVGGQSKDAAKHSLRDAGYEVKVNPGAEFDDNVPKGEVLRTDPDGGTRLATGRTVTITLSNGPQTYRIPSVRRALPETARKQLIALGKVTVAMQVRQEYSDSVPEARVTRTKPAAGSLVTRHDTITIYVSKGPSFVQVPSLSDGTSADDEITTLKNSDGKFKTTTTERYSDTVAEGDVISVSPSGRVRKFSTIEVTVSKGRHTATVPNIPFGTPLAEAEASVRAVGLVPEAVAFLGSGTPTSGRVVGTSPDADKVVDYGSTVTLQVLPG